MKASCRFFFQQFVLPLFKIIHKLPNFDFTGDGNAVWGMSGMKSTLPSQQDQPKNKLAEDFLGANANLVNLDDLISKPPPSS